MKNKLTIILSLIFILAIAIYALFFKKEEEILNNEIDDSLIISSQMVAEQGVNYIVTIEKPEISAGNYSEKFNALIEEYISDLINNFKNEIREADLQSTNELAGYYEIIALKEDIISLKFNVFQSLTFIDYPVENVKFFNFDISNGEEILLDYVLEKRDLESIADYCKNILSKNLGESFDEELLYTWIEPKEDNFKNFALIDNETVIFYFQDSQIGSVLQEVEVFLSSGNSQVLNLASAYCEKSSGSLEIRDFSSGQVGYCIFSDESECEEWEFFRGECQKGESFCRDYCGDGECQEIVCMGLGCPCVEDKDNCLIDCK